MNRHVFREERQVTFGSYGHTLNRRQVFSPDGLRVFYDTRNVDSDIASTQRVECVELSSGKVECLYRLPHASPYGPGLGAVACHPMRDELVFIHGLDSCNAARPYSSSRRFGALLDAAALGPLRHAEGRWMGGGLPAGVLRGGTHAHSWSPDGIWISFTYNDAIIEQASRTNAARGDLRTVGAMRVPSSGRRESFPGGAVDSLENFPGTYWAGLVAAVIDHPAPGSDEIDAALEECWCRFSELDNAPTVRTLAFQGRTRDEKNQPVLEVFVSQFPDAIPTDGEYVFAAADRLAPMRGTIVRRVTRTGNRRFPGIQGPRNWLVASPNGRCVYCPMRDDAGVVQIYEVEIATGNLRQVSTFEHSIQDQISLNSDASLASVVSDNQIWLLQLDTGFAWPLTERTSEERRPSGAIHICDKNKRLVYNRYQPNEDGNWLQIFTIDGAWDC